MRSPPASSLPPLANACTCGHKTKKKHGCRGGQNLAHTFKQDAFFCPGDNRNPDVTCCAMSGDMIAAGQAKKLIVCSATTRGVTHTFFHTGRVTCCAVFARRADRLVVAGDDAKELVVWDLVTSKARHEFRHGGQLTCCAISDDPDCDQLVAGDAAHMPVVRGPVHGEVRHAFEHTDRLMCCAISGNPPYSKTEGKGKKEEFKAVKSFNASEESDLSIKAGNALRVLREVSGWSLVVNTTNENNKAEGWVPSSCVTSESQPSLIAATDARGQTVRKGAMLGIQPPGLPTPEGPHGRRCLEHPRAYEGPPNASSPTQAVSRKTSQFASQLAECIKGASSTDWKVGSRKRLSSLSTGSWPATASRHDEGIGHQQEDCQENIEVLCQKVGAHPQLLHCRGEWFGNGRETTLLHMLANADEAYFPAASLEAVLNAVDKPSDKTIDEDDVDGVPFVLVPCYDIGGNTPLDVALNVGNEKRAELLAKAYVTSADRAAERIGKALSSGRQTGGFNTAKHVGASRSNFAAWWPWPHVTIVRLIDRLAKNNPDRLGHLRDAARLDMPSPHNFPSEARSRLPRFIPADRTVMDRQAEQNGKWRHRSARSWIVLSPAVSIGKRGGRRRRHLVGKRVGAAASCTSGSPLPTANPTNPTLIWT